MGWSGITKLYRFNAVLCFRKNHYLYLEKPVRIDEIELSPTEFQNKVSVSFTVRADSDKEAMREAEKFIDSLCTAILLSTNIAVDAESINIVSRVEEACETRYSDTERTKTIAVHIVIQSAITLKEEVSVSLSLSLSEPHIKRIIEIAGKIAGFDELVNRFFRWYRWALLEDDPIDRFIKLWIAFEIWAEYKGYKKGKEEGEKIKMTNALVKECVFSEEEANEIYAIRCSIFHSGVYDKALNKLSKLEKCLETVVLNYGKTSLSNLQS